MIGLVTLIAFLVVLAVAIWLLANVISAAHQRATTKQCPACRERVDKQATICKHCRTALT